MKTKFRELYLKAGFSPTHMWEWQRIQEFAELIALECAHVCNSDSISSPYYATKILKHFELEETDSARNNL